MPMPNEHLLRDGVTTFTKIDTRSGTSIPKVPEHPFGEEHEWSIVWIGSGSRYW